MTPPIAATALPSLHIERTKAASGRIPERRALRARWLAACALVAYGCAFRSVPQASQAKATNEPAGTAANGTTVGNATRSSARSGSLRVLSYNVAGLPGFLSSSHPGTNHALISPLLNRYDLVFAQEDFAYHRQLVQSTKHLYSVSPLPPASTMFGDGLCGLSVFPLDLTTRVRWESCFGYFGYSSDCFGEKGFSMARAQLTRGVLVDVYNLHAEAGDSREDQTTRRQGFLQLAAYIRRHSASNAIILAGDTNLDTQKSAYDRSTFKDFVANARLRDACRESGCEHPGVDRVLFRSSAQLLFHAATYGIDPRFVDDEGQALSDHLPVFVELNWHATGD